MKTYQVTIQERSIYSVEVPAKTKEEAEETAMDLHHNGKSDFVSVQSSEPIATQEIKR